MTAKYYLTFILFISLVVGSFGQPAEHEIRRESYISKNFKIDGTPDPGNLGFYGDFETNKFSGTLTFQKKLYELSSKWVKVPIGLYYNGQGNRLFAEAGYPGLAFSLNAGGSITRQVNAFPDMKANYYDHAADLLQPSLTDDYEENDFLTRIAKGEIESQPDHYIVNFLSYSFTMYISPNKEIVMESSQDLDIQILWDTSNDNILTFTIKDTQGNTYFFTTTEYTEMYYDQNQWAHLNARINTFNSTWHLSRIETAIGGEIIEFDYYTANANDRYELPINSYQYQTRVHYDDNTTDCNSCPVEATVTSEVTTGGPNPSWVYLRRHLKEIRYIKDEVLVESVYFTASDNPCYALSPLTSKKLDKIEVKRHAGTTAFTLLTFDFGYDCSTNRLTLKSLTESGNGGAAKPPWLFEYASGALPTLAGNALVRQDHWGFPNTNGATNGLGPSMIPTFHGTNETFGDGANRQVDTIETLKTALVKVTLPTSGYKIFEYEPHKIEPFTDKTVASGQSDIAGGLRIAAITHYDSDDTPLTKRSYKYQLEDGSPSGKLLQRLAYNRSSTYENEDACHTTCYIETIMASSIPTISGGSSNNIVGYSRVEEIISDATGGSATAGKTVCWYRNEEISGNYDEVENGQLYRKEVYDDSTRMVALTETTYSTDAPNQPALPRYKSFTKFKVVAEAAQDTKTHLCQIGNDTPYWIDPEDNDNCDRREIFESKYERKEFVPLIQKWVYPTGKTETRFFYNGMNPAGSVATTTIYTYGDTLVTLPTQTIVTNSDGEVFKTVNAYLSVADTSLNPYRNLWHDYRHASPIFTEHYINNDTVYTFRYEYANPNGGEVPVRMYEKFPEEDEERLAETFDLRDDASNLRRAFRAGQEPNAMIYSNYKCKAAAKVQNADYDEVAFTSFDTSEDVQGEWVMSGHQSSDFKIEPNIAYSGTSYLHSSGTVTFVADDLPEGTYRLSFAKKNTTSVNITGGLVHIKEAAPDADGWIWTVNTYIVGSSGSISFTVNGELDELRLHPIDALMSTASFDRYSRLINGIVDESGIPTQITYDGLLRPTAIKNFDKHFLKHLKYEYEAEIGVSKNSVKTFDVLVDGITSTAQVYGLSVSNTEVQPVFGYIDGIGRNIQTIEVEKSPLLRDHITPVFYDVYSRQVEHLFPYTIANTNGDYRSNALSEQEDFCADEFGEPERYFGKIAMDIELSPLNRILEEKPSGSIFEAHPQTTTYGTNAAGEVRNFHAANAWIGAGELFKVTQTDENGNTTSTFTDKVGRMVMQNREGKRTYFLYNHVGKQEQVITPEGSKLGHDTPGLDKTSSSIKDRSYLYTYDERYRVKSKKIPGAATYFYYYNDLDQIVLVKDGKGFQTFTKYDALLRPIMTGRYTGTDTPGLNQNRPQYEVRDITKEHYYTTHQSFPVDSTEIDIYTVSYYDNYNFDNGSNQEEEIFYETPQQDGNLFPASHYPFADGKITGTKTAILNNDGNAPNTFLWTYSFYDKFGRIIHTRSDNHLQGVDKEWTDYNYPGWVMNTRKEHSAITSAGNQSLVISESFTYDHAGRPKISTYKLDDTGTPQVLCEKIYNERDELKTKKLGATPADGFLQFVNYDYNIRKWMTHINQNMIANDLFQMELVYGEGDANFSGSYANGAAANYNGNITMMKWQHQNGDKHVYGFYYDHLNRLTTTDYGTQIGANYNLSNEYSTNYGYDLNGNITSILRQGLTDNGIIALIDDLDLSYNDVGQLDEVTEDKDKLLGFKTKSLDGTAAYSYDDNGNMIEDNHKELDMFYNHFNLPNKVESQTTTEDILWLYDAASNKLQKQVRENLTINDDPIPSGEYIGTHSIISDGRVANGDDVTFTAGEQICLEAGFEVELGGEFLAQIGAKSVRDYVGNLEYFNGELEAIYHESGRVVKRGSSWEFQYDLKDHLGNTRVLFKDNGSGVAEVLGEWSYYPNGLTHNGIGSNASDPKMQYQFAGKELNEDLGVDIVDFGARGLDKALVRWWQIDPLAEDYYGWSPYNYVMGNPVRFLDPDGKSVENTIFLDTDGNEIGRTEDNLPDAIVVVSDENMSDFNQTYMGAVLSPDYIGDDDVTNLRQLGDSYMVDGMEAVWDASMATTLAPENNGGFVDKNGNPIKDLHPEAGSYFNVSEDGQTLTVDPDIRVSESTDIIGLGGSRPAIHSHPIHGGLYEKTPFGVNGPATEKERPSHQDAVNSRGRQRDNPSRYNDVVIGPNNIYLYKGSKNKGIAPRSFFKDKK